jgi:hypothetical protein
MQSKPFRCQITVATVAEKVGNRTEWVEGSVRKSKEQIVWGVNRQAALRSFRELLLGAGWIKSGETIKNEYGKAVGADVALETNGHPALPFLASVPTRSATDDHGAFEEDED